MKNAYRITSRACAVLPAFMILLSGYIAPPLLAQPPPPNYGFNWATIGAPGNRGTNASEVPSDPSLVGMGSVDHEYRMMTSKLDVENYLQFVNAYAPHYQGNPWDPTLTGFFILPHESPGGHWTYAVMPGAEHCAARIEWQMAARYCNWLQNDKRTDRAAFENGVYDTSTFHFTGPNWTAQILPSPGARYWIPDRDEWVKAAYYDPNRGGPGQEGYWMYPNASDQPLVMGLPANGGQTIGDLLWQGNPSPWAGQWPLGQYPTVQSPWGLTDISATVPDYTSFVTSHANRTVFAGGSLAGSALYSAYDRLDWHTENSLWASTLGAVRIASSVPTPAGSVILGLGLLWGGRRSRQHVHKTGNRNGGLSVDREQGRR